jgi:hypothetical protein
VATVALRRRVQTYGWTLAMFSLTQLVLDSNWVLKWSMSFCNLLRHKSASEVTLAGILTAVKRKIEHEIGHNEQRSRNPASNSV